MPLFDAFVAYIYTQPTDAQIIHLNIHVEIIFNPTNHHEMREFQHACIITYLVQICICDFLLFHGLVLLTYPLPLTNLFLAFPSESTSSTSLPLIASPTPRLVMGLCEQGYNSLIMFASSTTFPTSCPFPLVSSPMVSTPSTCFVFKGMVCLPRSPPSIVFVVTHTIYSPKASLSTTFAPNGTVC